MTIQKLHEILEDLKAGPEFGGEEDRESLKDLCEELIKETHGPAELAEAIVKQAILAIGNIIQISDAKTVERMTKIVKSAYYLVFGALIVGGCINVVRPKIDPQEMMELVKRKMEEIGLELESMEVKRGEDAEEEDEYEYEPSSHPKKKEVIH